MEEYRIDSHQSLIVIKSDIQSKNARTSRGENIDADNKALPYITVQQVQ